MFFRWFTPIIGALFISQSAEAKPTEKDGGEEILFQERSSTLWAPTAENQGGNYPLLVVLHGYIHSSRRDYFSLYLGVNSYVKNMDHYLLEVYGTENPEARWFWNAEDACCDFHDQKPNDVEYLSSLIQKIAEEKNIDSERIIVMGHSNGGFMAHRLACEWGDNLHSVINVAGAAVMDFSECELEKPPNILNIHGTWDQIIEFDGGDLKGKEYPSAQYSTEKWSELSGCTNQAQTTRSSFRILSGNNIDVEQYSDCEQNNKVELWAVKRHGHLPSFSHHSVLNDSLEWALEETSSDKTISSN